jgi:hypothetical protein
MTYIISLQQILVNIFIPLTVINSKIKLTKHRIMKNSILALLVFVAAISVNSSAQPKSIKLFNGKNLKGWHADVPKMDEDPALISPFIIRNKMLVSLGTPGGHLITDEVYQNYRLHVEYRFAAKPGNCGVLVHASKPRALYDMFPQSIEVQMENKNAGDFWCIVEDIKVPDMVARRGPEEKWGITEGKNRRIPNLTDDSENPVGEWNTMIIECVGNEIKVWVNGDFVNHGFDCTANKGQIAVQAEGSEVEFRKIELTPLEEEWVSLFNGKDLTGWDIKISGHELNDNYLHAFKVEDGMIRINYDEYSEFNDKFGHMYYEKPYSYYKIKFDYRFVGDQIKGGSRGNMRNSGIMLHSQSAISNNLNQNFPVSIELQLLGGLGTRPRTTANVCTPGTAVELNNIVDYRHCINSSSKTYDGDQWIHAEAVVMGDEYMTFMVNGDSVLTFQKPQVGGGFISKQNEGKDWDQFGVTDKEIWISKEGNTLTEGYIALQSESHPIDFKNIEVLDLVGCMDKKAKNYKSYFVKADNSTCLYK